MTHGPEIDLTPLIAALAELVLGEGWEPPPPAPRSPTAEETLRRQRAVTEGVRRLVRLIHCAVARPVSREDSRAARHERRAGQREDYRWLRGPDGGRIPPGEAAERAGISARTAARWEATREGAA